MWYRFAGRKDIEQILNNDQNKFEKVKRITSGISDKQRHLYDYLAAFYINEDESQLKNLIDDLYEYNKQYPDLFSSNPQNFRINKTTYDRNTPFLKLNEIVHSLGQLNKKQDTTQYELNSSGKGVEIFPINSASDAMKFNTILPWQGTPWCITWRSGNLWWSYRTHMSATFYIVIDHDRSQKDPLYAVAINHSKNGLNLTDLRNTKEYSADQYLQELYERHPEISNANFPHKPLTEEEKHEQMVLSYETDDLDAFIALSKDKAIKDPWLKYIQFPHSLTDEQLQYLLSFGNSSKELINAYVNNGLGISPQQQKMLSSEDLKSYERIKQHNIEFAEKNDMLSNLLQLSDKDPDYQQKIINLGLSKDENGMWNHPNFNTTTALKYIPDNQKLDYVDKIIDHHNFNPNSILYYIPEDQKLDYVDKVIDHPDFNPSSIIDLIPRHKRLNYVDKVINHPIFDPNYFISFIPKNQRLDYVDKVINHPNFNPNSIFYNISDNQRLDYVDKTINHPKFDFKIIKNSLFKPEIQELLQRYPNNPRITQSFNYKKFFKIF